MTMITPSYLGETIEYSSLHACRSTLEDPTAANDPRRIMSRQMFSFDTDAKYGIVGLVYEFNEPDRWREVQQHPEMFTGLEAEDVSSAGCEFIWKKTAGEFIASHDPKHCHTIMPAVGDNAAELTFDTLSIGNYHFRRTKPR